MSLLRGFRYWHETVLAVLLGCLLLAVARLDPAFVSAKAQTLLSTHIWELALIAVPMLLIVISGGIDLSVGSAMALCAVVLGLCFERGVPVFWAAVIAVALGAGLGALNGWFVAKVRVHPLIVTLATLAAFRGIAEGVSLARPISGFPDGFTRFATGSGSGAPWPAIIFAVSLVAAGLMLAKTPLGRCIFVIGHNETAARFSGLPVARIKQLLYTLAGTASGLASVMLVARRNTAKADLGTGMELDVITAVVLGGASINGGRGNVVGLVLGLALIHETREFVSWRWQRDELNFIVVGGLLVLSVLLNQTLSRRTREES